MKIKYLYTPPCAGVVILAPRKVTCQSNIEDRDVIEGDWND